MKSRTAKALAGTKYILNPSQFPALIAAVEYAAQNPGLDYGNYGNRVAYNAESRSIRKDWVRVCNAVVGADKAGVTDDDIIKAAPRAFSGRLSWKSRKVIQQRVTNPAKYGGTHKGGIVKWEAEVWYWDYTAGQYWPTEYRKAVASVMFSSRNRSRHWRIASTHWRKCARSQNRGAPISSLTRWRVNA